MTIKVGDKLPEAKFRVMTAAKAAKIWPTRRRLSLRSNATALSATSTSNGSAISRDSKILRRSI
jgi:hypothetical protein